MENRREAGMEGREGWRDGGEEGGREEGREGVREGGGGKEGGGWSHGWSHGGREGGREKDGAMEDGVRGSKPVLIVHTRNTAEHSLFNSTYLKGPPIPADESILHNSFLLLPLLLQPLCHSGTRADTQLPHQVRQLGILITGLP